MDGGGAITTVVKYRRGSRPEPFKREKLHKSIVAACLASGSPMGPAEITARRVVDDVEDWLEKRPEVTTNDIRRVAAQTLRTYHPDASYLYEHHRTTL